MATQLYDIFISHAYKDKSAFAGELALGLKKKGLHVWCWGFDADDGGFGAGMHRGLSESKLGVVIIGPFCLATAGVAQELPLLFAQPARKRMLPVLHNLIPGEIKTALALLGSPKTVAFSHEGPAVVTRRILRLLPRKKKTKPRAGFPRKYPKSAAPPGTILLGDKKKNPGAPGQ